MPMTQARTLAVSGAALPRYGDTSILTPTRLSGTAALGELFEYTLELKTPDSLAFSPSIAANIDLDALIGTEVTCSIEIEGKGEFIAGMMGDSGAAGIGAGIREITGVVTHARIIREEGRSIVYGLTLRPWLWLATKNQDSRLFQDMTVIEITDSVLGAYPFPVDKRLIETYPKRDIQRQYWESDFDFIGRLWQEWGIYFWFEHSDGKHRLVLCDSIGAHKPHGPAYQTIRYEAPTGKRIDEEHIHALTVTNALTIGTVSTLDYDYTWPRADLRTTLQDPCDTAFANQEHYDWGDYAQPQAGATGLSSEHNQPKQEAEFLARVRAQALRCEGLRASGTGNLRGLETGQTFTLTHYAQSEANREYLVISSTLDIANIGEETQSGNSAGNGQRYRCVTDFVIQPAREVFRSLRTLKKPRSYGPETAIVVGPADQEIWTDSYGRLKIQFPWDRQGQNDERSSCWMRSSSAWQGNEFGATHLARVGQEVLVDYLNGDPDLPIVTGRVVNAFQLPAWKLPGNQALSGFRSRELNGGRANHLVMDDTEGKIQAQLSSDHALSQLNLGSITRIPGNVGRQDPRGGGFELRTDEHGVVRAADGLLITTEARANAQAHAKDMGETVQRLTQARELQESLADLAQQHQAQDEGKDQSDVAKALKAQNDAIRGGAKTDDNAFPEFAEPHLTLASPVGIQSTTAGSTHLASDEHLALTTGGHVGIAAGKSLFATVAQSFKVFVHKFGIKLIAASGKVHIEAQQGNIEIQARKLIEFISTADWINLKGVKGVRLNGGGTELELSAEGLLGFTAGAFKMHAASHATAGPKSKGGGFPPFPQSGPGQLELIHQYANGHPVRAGEYTVTDSAGVVKKGSLDASGKAIVSGLIPGAVSVVFGHDPTDPLLASSYFGAPHSLVETSARDAVSTVTLMDSAFSTLLPGAASNPDQAAGLAKQAMLAMRGHSPISAITSFRGLDASASPPSIPRLSGTTPGFVA